MAQQQKVALRFGRERVYLALTQRQPVCPVITPIAKVLTRVNGRGRDRPGPYWLTFPFPAAQQDNRARRNLARWFSGIRTTASPQELKSVSLESSLEQWHRGDCPTRPAFTPLDHGLGINNPAEHDSKMTC